MSRDAGFLIADVDVGLLRDVKLRRLRHQLPEEDVAPATLLYLALVLSSWEEGDRLPIVDADAPVAATPERIAALERVGLIDGEGRIPEHAWRSWFIPAWERREKVRAGAQRGNAKRWGSDSLPDSHGESPPDSPPDSPSVPSVPSVPIRTEPSVLGPRYDDHPSANGRRRATTNGLARVDLTTCPACGDGPLETTDANVVLQGLQLWHRACPSSQLEALA